MSLDLERLTLVETRLNMLGQRDTDLRAQYLELLRLREQLREAELSANTQNIMRALNPASLAIPTTGDKSPGAADYASS